MSEVMPENADDLILRTIKEESERHAVEAAARHGERLSARLSRRRVDWDVRGILAIMALIGAFALAFAQLITGSTAEIPAWAAAIVAGVTGFYFGSRGGTSNGSYQRRENDL